MPNHGGTYGYSSQPHSAPISNAKKLMSKTGPAVAPVPILADPRVARGNTYALARKVAKKKELLSQTMTAEIMADTRVMALGPEEDDMEQRPMPTYSYEVKPFRNEEVDFSSNLIAKDEGAYVPVKETKTQTDAFSNPAPVEEYIPLKTGIDKDTQVEDVTELFDFNEEVKPLLEVIVHKTLEQALYEVDCEIHLMALDQEEKKYHDIMEKENQWVLKKERDMMEEEKVKQEKIRKLEEIKAAEINTKRLVAAKQLASQILPLCLDETLDNLIETGTFILPDVQDARTNLIPRIVDKAKSKTDSYMSAVSAMDEIIAEVGSMLEAKPQCCINAPKTTLNILFKKKLKSDVVEGEENVDTEQKFEEEAVEFDIGYSDSINSLDNKIAEYIKGVKLAANPPVKEATEEDGEKEAENVEETPVDSATIALAALLPDLKQAAGAGWTYRSRLPFNFAKLIQAAINSYWVTLSSAYYSRESCNSYYLNRTIALDASLSNFNLPESIFLEVELTESETDD